MRFHIAESRVVVEEGKPIYTVVVQLGDASTRHSGSGVTYAEALERAVREMIRQATSYVVDY